jgi:hypothetical protein
MKKKEKLKKINYFDNIYNYLFKDILALFKKFIICNYDRQYWINEI